MGDTGSKEIFAPQDREVSSSKLIDAAANGQVDAVSKLLKKGKKVNKKDERGDTGFFDLAVIILELETECAILALHMAALYGHLEIIEMLLHVRFCFLQF